VSRAGAIKQNVALGKQCGVSTMLIGPYAVELIELNRYPKESMAEV
jgi:hypothetical protein